MAPPLIYANPTFYISGTSSGIFKETKTWGIYLNTDSQLLTAVQTVVNFDSELFNQIQLSNLGSRCSFWAPADPSLGLGNSVTPYFLDRNKIVLSCGFSRPGYNSSSSTGDLLLSFTLEPFYLGTASFTFSDTQLRYVDAVIDPGEMTAFEYEVMSTDSAATPSPTPVPVLATPYPTPLTLTTDDLTFVDITATSSNLSASSLSNASLSALQNLAAASLDDTIPPPPDDLEERPSATPYVISQAAASAEDEGDVLSIQSLRELLVPGSSDADRRLVVFNLMVILTFLVILAIVIWRLILARRAHRLKLKHMNELIEGELSVIESKVQAVKQGYGETDDVMRSLDELKQDLDEEV